MKKCHDRDKKRTNVRALTGAGIDCYDDASLEDEAKGGGSVVWFDVFDDFTLERVELWGMRGGNVSDRPMACD